MASRLATIPLGRPASKGIGFRALACTEMSCHQPLLRCCVMMHNVCRVFFVCLRATQSLADFDDEEYHKMVCVEPGVVSKFYRCGAGLRLGIRSLKILA